jgi:hypothetical protein
MGVSKDSCATVPQLAHCSAFGTYIVTHSTTTCVSPKVRLKFTLSAAVPKSVPGRVRVVPLSTPRSGRNANDPRSTFLGVGRCASIGRVDVAPTRRSGMLVSRSIPRGC